MMIFMNEVIFQVLRLKAPNISIKATRRLADAIEARLIETCWYTPTTMFSQSEITRAAG